ncbi:transmembrane protein 154 isoform X1 [Gymnodraco acuticeps]|uniref:Transmembrane protein 154 isoform X1 n=1 Tax=Gymnodraco acuticeps TaxID=8218 RepID=A0A6P8VP03_GYMAC|nr:transmembrane protein 154 isoform X1 [Gymnodraco acuticeps]XP_034087118.1 transmembrane protein 154 isoform X1 [Gymnodraco acuticeps]
MFASGTGSMRGPGLKTPLLLLLLLLLGTVFCQEEDDENVEEEADTDIEYGEEPGEAAPGADGEPEVPDVSESTLPPDLTTTYLDVETTIGEEQDGSRLYNEDFNTTDSTDLEPDEGLGLLIILIPVVLVVLIIAFIVFCIFINRRWKQNQINQELRKEDPYLDGSSTEKVPMPMFEEDVPSVLELEMEELDNWMRKDDNPAEDSKHL